MDLSFFFKGLLIGAAVSAPDAPDRLVSSPDDLHPSPDGYRLMMMDQQTSYSVNTKDSPRLT